MLVDGGCQSSTEMLKTPSLLLFEAALDGHPPSTGTRLLYLRHKVLQVGTHMTLTCPLMYQHLSNLAGLYGIRIRSWWRVETYARWWRKIKGEGLFPHLAPISAGTPGAYKFNRIFVNTFSLEGQLSLNPCVEFIYLRVLFPSGQSRPKH